MATLSELEGSLLLGFGVAAAIECIWMRHRGNDLIRLPAAATYRRFAFAFSLRETRRRRGGVPEGKALREYVTCIVV